MKRLVLVLLAALLLCPLMAVAAAVPAEASCHETQDPDSATAFACCESVVASAKAGLDAPPAVLPLVLARSAVPPVVRQAQDPRPGCGSPPLFLRNLSLRI